MKFLWLLSLALFAVSVYGAEVEEEDHVLVLTAVSPLKRLFPILYFHV